MPIDLTMCGGDGCPLRADCYRHRAQPAGRQDWLARAPYDPTGGTCASFLPIGDSEPTKAAVRERAYHIWLRAGRPAGCAGAHWAQARSELRKQRADRLRPLPLK